MKNYKQILEAINRGIQLALDDMEDIEDINPMSQNSDVINSEDVLQHYAKFYAIIKKLGIEIVPKKDINNLIVYSKEHNVKYVPKDKDDLTRILHIFLNQHTHENLNWIDTSRITDMSWLFANTSFNGDISEWDVSNVIDMSYMFENNQIFNCDISQWNVSNVRNMNSMFKNACNFKCDISLWNPCNVEDATDMFFGATNFNCDLGNWHMYKCKKFGDMLTNCGHKRNRIPDFFNKR